VEKLRLGRTGLMVTRVGFGAIPIQRLPESDALAVVRQCLDMGINFIDTANAYTNSEERIGKAIAGRNRKDLILATKSLDRTAAGVEKHLHLSLKRLGTGYIDLYQFHNVSDASAMKAIFAPEGPLAVVEKAKQAGLVRHIGVSSHAIDIAKKLVKSDRFETMMFPFNFITREPGEELLPLARAHDVGFIVMKPLAGGVLENVILAFKYLFQFPDIVPIPGIEKAPEMAQILGILEGDWKLTQADNKEMKRLRAELGTRFCRRCDYCQPCTEGIQISLVMQTANILRRLPPQSVFAGGMTPEFEKAAGCSHCGECEKRCPFHLPIPNMVAEYNTLFRAERRKWEETRG
jgi:predicted aldo/keto reductase-like oxidoreductase